MGRPPTHSADDFVDAAVRLFAGGGARAVTMTSVAREVGARSGSVYHRFPDRPALLSAVWLRTTRRFQDEFLAVLAENPGADAVIAASGWTVDWCRDNLGEAIVLHAGMRAFSPHTWPDSARAEMTVFDEQRDREAARVVRQVRAQTDRDPDQILLALLDLPIAVAGRYLARGIAPPPTATKLATHIARLIMLGEPA